jgi:hypothetical protein
MGPPAGAGFCGLRLRGLETGFPGPSHCRHPLDPVPDRRLRPRCPDGARVRGLDRTGVPRTARGRFGIARRQLLRLPGAVSAVRGRYPYRRGNSPLAERLSRLGPAAATPVLAAGGALGLAHRRHSGIDQRPVFRAAANRGGSVPPAGALALPTPRLRAGSAPGRHRSPAGEPAAGAPCAGAGQRCGRLAPEMARRGLEPLRRPAVVQPARAPHRAARARSLAQARRLGSHPGRAPPQLRGHAGWLGRRRPFLRGRPRVAVDEPARGDPRTQRKSASGNACKRHPPLRRPCLSARGGRAGRAPAPAGSLRGL